MLEEEEKECFGSVVCSWQTEWYKMPKTTWTALANFQRARRTDQLGLDLSETCFAQAVT
jgi:hypothetical protein